MAHYSRDSRPRAQGRVKAVIAWHGRGRIDYIPFPEELEGSYQHFTEADLTRLRAAGYDRPFLTVEEGVERYLDALHGPRATD